MMPITVPPQSSTGTDRRSVENMRTMAATATEVATSSRTSAGTSTKNAGRAVRVGTMTAPAATLSAGA